MGYNITYKDQGNTNFTGAFIDMLPPELHLYGETTIIPVPSRSGYEFKGWYLTSDCSGEPVNELTDENCHQCAYRNYTKSEHIQQNASAPERAEEARANLQTKFIDKKNKTKTFGILQHGGIDGKS